MGIIYVFLFILVDPGQFSNSRFVQLCKYYSKYNIALSLPKEMEQYMKFRSVAIFQITLFDCLFHMFFTYLVWFKVL